jgi:hypothetical protein
VAAEIWILGVSLFVAGVVLVALGRRQRDGTLQRNWLAGLRTSETMRSDAAWDAAHGATAGLISGAGVVQLAGGVAVVVLRPTDDPTLAALVLGSITITLGLVLAAGFRGHRIAKRVNHGEVGDHTDDDR